MKTNALRVVQSVRRERNSIKGAVKEMKGKKAVSRGSGGGAVMVKYSGGQRGPGL